MKKDIDDNQLPSRDIRENRINIGTSSEVEMSIPLAKNLINEIPSPNINVSDFEDYKES